MYCFQYTKNKSKEFYFCCQTFLIVFIFLSPLSMSFWYLLARKEFLLFFRWLESIWLFSLFLRRTLCNTWNRHYWQLNVPIMVLNKKALVSISSVSNSKEPPWNLLSFVSRSFVSECLKSSLQNCVSLT